jgi:flavin-dependent dehydrogenase
VRVESETKGEAMSRRVDALIVGGGPSGAALGALLARAGRSIAIVEKSAAAHDKMCGDFLSYEAVQYLGALGLDLGAMRAIPISNVRLAARTLIGECPLPFTAMALRRSTLDEALLQNAEKSGANILRGRRVDSLQPCGDRWTARLAEGEEICAASAFLATGKHDLHGWPRAAGKQNDLVAFKMYFRLTPRAQAALAKQVELILFPGGYAGLLPLSEGAMNLCLLARRSELRRHEGSWPKLFEHVRSSSPYLARYLEGATPLLERPLALSSIPYGYICPGARDGLWRLGDQAAVIPSFSGDGISIALHSAHVAALDFLEGRSADEFHRRLSVQLRRPVGAATTLSRIMIAAPALAQALRFWPEALNSITRLTRVPRGELLAAVA